MSYDIHYSDTHEPLNLTWNVRPILDFVFDYVNGRRDHRDAPDCKYWRENVDTAGVYFVNDVLEMVYRLEDNRLYLRNFEPANGWGGVGCVERLLKAMLREAYSEGLVSLKVYS